MRRPGLAVPLAALAAAAIGCLYIHSASFEPRTGEHRPFARAQAIWLAVAVAGFAAAAAIPYSRFERHAYLLYGAGVALLAGLPFFGSLANGARAWYQVGSAKVQPSEFMKIALILATAKLLMYRKDVCRGRGFLMPFLVAAPPIALILLQPDLGTALVFFPMLLAMLFVAGARLWHFAALFGAVAAAGAIAFFVRGLDQYQRLRILVFLDPERDPLGAGFQALQSRIAVGSGGLFGQGLGEGSQTQLHFVPDSHTDFIFAVIAEEGGLFVAATVLLLLLAITLGCLGAAFRIREPFGRLVAVGVAALLAGEVLVNCGMTIGLVPIAGIALPFVSYGGSSLLTSFVALGLVANVEARAAPTLARDFEKTEDYEPLR